MTIDQIIVALQNAKLLEATKLQCGNVDNMSMLVAVATGKVATYNELYELYNQLIEIDFVSEAEEYEDSDGRILTRRN